jgi:hypothetical protein
MTAVHWSEGAPTWVDGFGIPEAWVVTDVMEVSDEIPDYSWRTSGYLATMAKLYRSIRDAGYDPDSGVFQVFDKEGRQEWDKLIIGVAKGLKRLEPAGDPTA